MVYVCLVVCVWMQHCLCLQAGSPGAAAVVEKRPWLLHFHLHLDFGHFPYVSMLGHVSTAGMKYDEIGFVIDHDCHDASSF